MSRVTRRSTFALLSLTILFAGLASPRAQESQIKWSDISCSEEKLRVPQGLKCRATAEYSGVADPISNSNGQAIFRRWAALGSLNGEKLYYYAIEGVSIGGYIVVDGTLESAVKNLSPYAKESKSYSSLAQINGGDYQRFVSSAGENCVGIRKVGPSHKRGVKWTLHATKCTTKGKSLSDAEIGQFIAAADFAG